MTKEERVKQAYEKGKEEIETKSGYLKGVGETLSKEGKEAAEKMSQGAGEVTKGVNEGFDKSMVRVKVLASPELLDAVSIGRAGKHFNDSTLLTGVSIYLIFEKEFKNRLILKAFDSDSTEVGRSIADISGKPDDAQYITFGYAHEVPLGIAQYFTLGIKR